MTDDLGQGRGLAGQAAGDSYVSIERVTGHSPLDCLLAEDLASMLIHEKDRKIFAARAADALAGASGENFEVRLLRRDMFQVVATVAVILGQLAMGMLIDNFGWLGNPPIELSSSRMLAMVCLALALVFMYRSSARQAD